MEKQQTNAKGTGGTWMKTEKNAKTENGYGWLFTMDTVRWEIRYDAKRHSFPFLKYTVNGSLCMQNNSLYKKNYLVFRQKRVIK